MTSWAKDKQRGCPAWAEVAQKDPTGQNEPIIIRADCVDNINSHWLFELVKLAESEIKTTESFRDGMVEEVNGQVFPKMGRAILHLADAVKSGQPNNVLGPVQHHGNGFGTGHPNTNKMLNYSE